MPPRTGRPTKDPKNLRLELRLSDSDAEKLDLCCKHFNMTKAQHKEMMDGIKQSIDESLSEMIGSEDYPSIVSIEANDDYTEYKIVVNTEEVGLAEGFLVMGFYIFSGMYHVFNGTEPGNINIKYINETTGAVIEEANSNDMG